MADTQRVPIDQDTRNRIESEINRNMCVEAGAGTGKTTIMVARIIEIIRTGYATIDSMVIITFTEKAAAELATRVREALESALRKSEDPQEQKNFDQALKNIYRARIETIHAFASSLLRERPVEARLDPNFEVLDTLRADLSFEEQFRTWINAYLGGDSETEFDISEFRRALNRGLGISDLRTICSIVHEHRYMIPLNIPDPPDPDVFSFREHLLAEAEALRNLLMTVKDPDDKGAIQIRRVLNFAERCRRAGKDRQRLERVILAANKTTPNAGNNGNWDPPANNKEQKEIRKHLNEAIEEIQQALRTSALCAILPLAQEFARNYEQQRRYAGQAEFEDLLIWARDLLRDKPHVREDFQRRFTCLLVDEFQDTDPLQVEIVMYLSSEDQNETDWTKLTPTPGKLFVVGDPKQSIYRFRRADISIYEQVKEEILSRNIEVIKQNFRSVPEVIDWVNLVFSELIAPHHRIQPEYIALDPFLESNGQERSPVVVVHSLDPSSRADAIRTEEAKLLAGTIKQAIEQEWPVRCEETDGLRPAQYGDIAILLPSRTGLSNYEDVFNEAGIPFRHEGGKEYFHRQEVRDLRACLRAIDNPGDAMSIVAALRSGAFGCSDQQLFFWRREHGNFDYRQVTDDQTDSVATALSTLRLLHESRINLSLPEIVEQTIEQTNLVEFALTLPNGGDQSAANLLKMVDQARAFASASGGGLRAFVRWTITSAETRSDESDAAVAESTDDVVRILTIHAAKGLEFPIVALANLNTSGSGRRGPQVIPNYIDRMLDVKIGKKDFGYTTPDFDQASESEDLHEDAERRRLFYVAATRAADYLVLPVAVDPEKASGLLCQMIKYLPLLTEDTRGQDVDGVHVLDTTQLPSIEVERTTRAPVTDDEFGDALVERNIWLDRRSGTLGDGNQPRRVVTASSQKAWEQNDTTEAGVETTPVDAPVERNLGLRIGNALHRIMEQLDLHKRTEVDATVEKLIDSALDDAEIARSDSRSRQRVRRMVQNALSSDILDRARHSTELVQEVEFGYGLPDGGMIQGQMDLVFVENDSIVVADFKSDRIGVGEANERARTRYAGQAAVYAYAANQITNLPVAEVVFYFAETGEAAHLSAEDLIERGRELALHGETQDIGYPETEQYPDHASK
jgi:ATP-dependent helicase/nuclease subunit A